MTKNKFSLSNQIKIHYVHSFIAELHVKIRNYVNLMTMLIKLGEGVIMHKYSKFNPPF